MTQIRKDLEKKLNVGAILISVVVFILVLLMRRIKINTGVDFSFLPPLHATLNGLAAVSLMMGFRAIKNRDAHRHRFWMLTAIVLSVLFLISYVVYHFTMPETPYCHQGWSRVVYFVLLIGHIVLAAVILPFILLHSSEPSPDSLTGIKNWLAGFIPFGCL